MVYSQNCLQEVIIIVHYTKILGGNETKVPIEESVIMLTSNDRDNHWDIRSRSRGII